MRCLNHSSSLQNCPHVPPCLVERRSLKVGSTSTVGPADSTLPRSSSPVLPTTGAESCPLILDPLSLPNALFDKERKFRTRRRPLLSRPTTRSQSSARARNSPPPIRVAEISTSRSSKRHSSPITSPLTRSESRARACKTSPPTVSITKRTAKMPLPRSSPFPHRKIKSESRGLSPSPLPPIESAVKVEAIHQIDGITDPPPFSSPPATSLASEAREQHVPTMATFGHFFHGFALFQTYHSDPETTPEPLTDV